MSLTVILAAIWLFGIPLVVITVAAVLTKLSDRRCARELDRWLTEVLSEGRSRSRLERRIRHHRKASRAVGPAGTLTQRSSDSRERT